MQQSSQDSSMGLDRLQYLLFDCTGAKAKRGYYFVGCFISVVAIVTSLTGLIGFFIDYLDGEAIYHSLPHQGHCIGYLLCLLIALVASVPPLALSLLAVHDLPNYEKQQNFAGRLCRTARFDNFYCHGSATRYLLLATLSAATIILCNTLSVCILHAGVGSLFHQPIHPKGGSSVSVSSIDRIQQRLGCCGLTGPDDWRQFAGLPKSCAATPPDDEGVVKAAINITLINSDGCASILTGEQAVISGISNMLAFTGILLLLAAWTRVERVAELTAKDVSNLFKEPRAPAEAAAFVERIGRQRSSRFSMQAKAQSRVSRVSTKAVKSSSEATVRRPSIQGLHAAGQFQKPLISDGFLYPSEDELDSKRALRRSRKLSSTEHNSEVGDFGSGAGCSIATNTRSNSSSSTSSSKSRSSSPSHGIPDGWSHIANCSLREVNENNSNKSENSNRNNSALDPTKQWVGARVINPISANLYEDNGSCEDSVTDGESPLPSNAINKDAVLMTNETLEPHIFKLLDVKGLERIEGENFRFTRRRKCKPSALQSGDYFAKPLSNFPTFLFDFPENQWNNQLLQRHQELEMPFSTRESANFVDEF